MSAKILLASIVAAPLVSSGAAQERDERRPRGEDAPVESPVPVEAPGVAPAEAPVVAVDIAEAPVMATEDGNDEDDEEEVDMTVLDAGEDEDDDLLGDTHQVFLRSRRGKFAVDGNPALKIHPCGRVQANTFGVAHDWEKITVHTLPAQEGSEHALVALQAWTGKYVSAKPNGDVDASFAEQIGDWEMWWVENCGDNFVALKSKAFGKYLACDNVFDCGKEVRANRDHAREWEHWVLVPQGQPHAYTDPGNTARIRLPPMARSAFGNTARIRLPPKALRAIGGSIFALGSVLTLGALAIPAIGFGVGGVAAGSAAAAVQSVLCGGATGGIFSVLQSAGATLVWVPYAAGGAAGVAAGAGVFRAGNEAAPAKSR